MGDGLKDDEDGDGSAVVAQAVAVVVVAGVSNGRENESGERVSEVCRRCSCSSCCCPVQSRTTSSLLLKTLLYHGWSEFALRPKSVCPVPQASVLSLKKVK